MRRSRACHLLLWLLILRSLTACSQVMGEQPGVSPMEPNSHFANFQSARPLVDNTVPYQPTLQPAWLDTGLDNDEIIVTMPLTITEAMLERGQEQYGVYCSPCHGLVGNGDGTVVQRGFPSPPSFHSDRLRQAPDGYLFQVISNGLGKMFGYASSIGPADRWAIVAYLRALQLSQQAPVDLLEPGARQELEERNE